MRIASTRLVTSTTTAMLASFPTGEDRRARSTTTLGTLGRVVTSTTTTTALSTVIPTASPDIGNDYVECHIGEEGYVFSDVWVFTEDSYGNKNS